MTEWISAREAAELTGIAEETIEWWMARGRIERRPRHGGRPCLDRDSVLEFAASYVPKGERAQQKPAPSMQRGDWLADHYSPSDVADLFEVSNTTVQRWVVIGRLSGDRHPDRGWLRFTTGEVNRLVAERQQWISYATAAEIIGVSIGTIRSLIASGVLEHRDVPRQQPSISRQTAEEYGARRHAERRERAARKLDRAAATRPPDDGEVWLSLTEAALVLRLSRTRVGQLVQSGRIPATKRGRRWWIRRLHAETLSASRAVRAGRN